MRKGIKIRITGWHIEPIKLSPFCKKKFKPLFLSSFSSGFLWTSDEFSPSSAISEYLYIYDPNIHWTMYKTCKESQQFTFKIAPPEYTGDKWSGTFSVRWGTQGI